MIGKFWLHLVQGGLASTGASARIQWLAVRGVAESHNLLGQPQATNLISLSPADDIGSPAQVLILPVETRVARERRPPANKAHIAGSNVRLLVTLTPSRSNRSIVFRRTQT